MYEWEGPPQDHYLLGTLIIKTVDRDTGRPLEGVHVGIADDLDTACQMG